MQQEWGWGPVTLIECWTRWPVCVGVSPDPGVTNCRWWSKFAGLILTSCTATSPALAMATWFDVGMVKVMAAKRNFKCRIWKCFTLKTKNCLMRLDVEKIVGPNIWRTDFAESSRIPWRIYSTSQKLVKYLMSSCSHILPVEIAQNISFPRALRI